MKKIMHIIFSILVIVIVLFGLLYLFQHKLIFFPQHLSKDHTFSFSQPFEERYFQTTDNIRIHALHFTVPEPKGLIYYFHGNAGSLEGWGQVARDFTQYNYDVLIIDYRGYGKSTGSISEKGLYHDAGVIYDTLKNEYPEKDIIVYGRSIGSGMATHLAAHQRPALLILESPFYNLPDVAKRYFPWFPKSLVRFKFRNDLHIGKVHCPVILIHGDQDEVINVQASYKLEKKLKEQDQLFIIKGGHHNDLMLFEEFGKILETIFRNKP